MNTYNIEFASTDNQENATAPWERPKQSTFQDLLVKPDFTGKRFSFPAGVTWFRIVPALLGSRGYMLDIHALKYPGGMHLHPKTLKPGAKSVFDLAYAWCKANRPECLYNKTNKNGYKLLADPMCLFWILVEEDEKLVSRLVIASGYDGCRGGTAGYGHQIWKLTQERDENGKLVANPVDALKGLQICIEKTQPPGSRYPSYTLRIGREPAPIGGFFDKMDTAEIAAITPLENVVYLPDAEEEWKLLEKVIDPETVAVIRAAQK
jgi:hypothetical protein